MDFTEKQDIEISPRYSHNDERDYNERRDSAATLQPGDPLKSGDTLKAGDVLRNAAIDGDEALKALELEEGETIVIDEDTNRRLLRKIGTLAPSHR
jgi:hypothetical protein